MTEQTLARESWDSLARAHSRLLEQFDASDVFSQASMHEYDVLAALADADVPVQLTELNRDVSLSQPGLSRLVDRLVARKLVDRRTNPRDRRGVLLSLTPAGALTQRAISDRHSETVSEAMNAALDQAELEQLQKLCEKLYERTSSLPAPRRLPPDAELSGGVAAYALRHSVVAAPQV